MPSRTSRTRTGSASPLGSPAAVDAVAEVVVAGGAAVPGAGGDPAKVTSAADTPPPTSRQAARTVEGTRRVAVAAERTCRSRLTSGRTLPDTWFLQVFGI